MGKWSARQLQRAWQAAERAAHFAEDQALQERNKAAKQVAGGQLEYIYRSQYLPEQGMFCRLPADLQLGTRLVEAEVRTVLACKSSND